MMVNLWIVTNDDQILASDKFSDIKDFPYTRYCVEQVSEEMYKAISKMSHMDEHHQTISTLLYEIVSKKWLSQN